MSALKKISFVMLSFLWGISQVVHSNGGKLDCKKVRIFVYSSTREQSNKKSGARLKTESETLKLY